MTGTVPKSLSRLKHSVSTHLREHWGLDPHPARVSRYFPNTLPHHLIHLFRLQRINCVIDVGANVGQYARMLRAAGYQGRIASFEPVEATFRLLQAESPKDEAWIKFQCALGLTDGSMPINVSASSLLSSFLPAIDTPPCWIHNPKGTEDLVVDHVELVAMARLDSVFASCVQGLPSPRVHLKLDTQGYDLQVIRGASESLASVFSIQSEISFQPIYQCMESWYHSLQEIQSFGFELTGFFPISKDTNLHLIEADVVLSRKGL